MRAPAEREHSITRSAAERPEVVSAIEAREPLHEIDHRMRQPRLQRPVKEAAKRVVVDHGNRDRAHHSGGGLPTGVHMASHQLPLALAGSPWVRPAWGVADSRTRAWSETRPRLSSVSP